MGPLRSPRSSDFSTGRLGGLGELRGLYGQSHLRSFQPLTASPSKSRRRPQLCHELNRRPYWRTSLDFSSLVILLGYFLFTPSMSESPSQTQAVMQPVPSTGYPGSHGVQHRCASSTSPNSSGSDFNIISKPRLVQWTEDHGLSHSHNRRELLKQAKSRRQIKVINRGSNRKGNVGNPIWVDSASDSDSRDDIYTQVWKSAEVGMMPSQGTDNPAPTSSMDQPS